MKNTEKLKVWHFCSIYRQQFIPHLLDSVSDVAENTVFFPRKTNVEFEDETASVQSPVLFQPWDRFLYMNKQKKGFSYLLENYDPSKFDLIHAHTLYTDGYNAYQMYQKYQLPYIVAVRSTDIHYFKKYRKDLFYKAKKILTHASKIITLSERYAQVTADYYHIQDRSKIKVIHNGLEPYFLENRYSGTKSNDPKKICVITVGHIHGNKNQLMVLEALKLLKSRGYEVHYTVIGNFWDKKMCEELAAVNWVDLRSFMPQDELLNVYRENDLLALVSKRETFGLTYIEAISQGLPVIYTAGEGFDHCFPEGEVGYPVVHGDIEMLAETILKIKQGKFEQLSKNAEKFSWESIGAEYSQIYKEYCRC